VIGLKTAGFAAGAAGFATGTAGFAAGIAGFVVITGFPDFGVNTTFWCFLQQNLQYQ
jgi:hypothetical protein